MYLSALFDYSTKAPEHGPQETLNFGSCGDFSFVVNQWWTPISSIYGLVNERR